MRLPLHLSAFLLLFAGFADQADGRFLAFVHGFLIVFGLLIQMAAERDVNEIIIDSERCKGCYLCIDACSKNCIERSGRPNAAGNYPAQFLADSECLACALCALVCPDVAIKVLRHVEKAVLAGNATA